MNALTSTSPPRRRHFAADRAFLPAALSILETPPSPVRTGLMLTIAAFVVSAIGWAAVGRLDIVAIAPGRVQPQGRVKTVQSVETGRVATLDTLNGVRVKAGDILFTLDPAPAKADAAEARTAMHSYRAEALRHGAAVASMHLSTIQAPAWPDDIPGEIRDREERVLASGLADLRSTVANLQAEMAQKRAERDRLDKTIIAQSTLVGTLQERVDMRTTLMNSGAGAKAPVIDARESQETQAAALVSELGQREEITAAITVAQTQVDKAYSDFADANDQKRAEAERQADDAARRLARAKVTLADLVVTTPIAGVVQGSILTTLGQVVTVGEEVMRVVPVDTPLEVDAYLANRDVGFVKEGQEVVVKIDAFPFDRYGGLTGHVVRVSDDAIPTPDAIAAEATPGNPTPDRTVAGGQATQNLVFPLTVALDARRIVVDGHPVNLSPGMAVSAEIKTGSRTMLDYLLSPVREVSSDAMRER